MKEAVSASPEHPVLVDRFLRDATEVDLIWWWTAPDGSWWCVMEHIQEAGVHSGDAACTLPPHSLSRT